MRVEKFNRASEDSLVLIQCEILDHEICLAIDTGASHTTIDLTTLLIAGYRVEDAIGFEKLETASGVIEAYVFRVRRFVALGIEIKDIEICAYDFFAHNVLTEFDGVLGLDFLKTYKICIDFRTSEITLS